MFAGSTTSAFSKDFHRKHTIFRRSGQPSITLDDIHFVLAHQELKSFGVLGDNLVFPGLDRGPVQLCTVDAFDSEFFRFLDVVVNLGVKEQRLGGNATHVQTRAAQLVVFFNQGHFEPILAAADCRSVSARPGADYGYIVNCLWQFKLPCLCEDRQQMAKH